MPEAFSSAAYGKQTLAVYATILDRRSSQPGELDPNDIIDASLAGSNFHFLKWPPIDR
jgi:hypothetical protein